MKKSLDDDKCHHCNKKIGLSQGICTEINGKHLSLCGACWNKHVSESMGLDFKTIELKPITLKDCSGQAYEFRFLTHMVPSGLAIEACEIRDDKHRGYEFSVLGDFDCNQADLILDLYEKMKRGLSKKFLKKRRGQTGVKDMNVAGRIEWDDNYEGQIPMLVIDGQEVTWAEFGKMLMTFEGWQFKLDIIDRAEDLRKKRE